MVRLEFGADGFPSAARKLVFAGEPFEVVLVGPHAEEGRKYVGVEGLELYRRTVNLFTHPTLGMLRIFVDLAKANRLRVVTKRAGDDVLFCFERAEAQTSGGNELEFGSASRSQLGDAGAAGPLCPAPALSSADAILIEGGLGKLAGRVALHRSLWLRDDPVGTGQLGGEIHPERGFDWPSWRGHRLTFLAQLPIEGADDDARLLFFYETESSPWGLSADHQGSARVVRVRAPVPQVGGIRVAPTPFDDLPDLFGSNAESWSHDLDGGEARRYCELRYGRIPRPYHHLGGEPVTIQDDPRASSRSMAASLGLEDQPWRLLLELHPDERLGWRWADDGHLSFCIGERDAVAGRCDRAWAILQTS